MIQTKVEFLGNPQFVPFAFLEIEEFRLVFHIFKIQADLDLHFRSGNLHSSPLYSPIPVIGFSHGPVGFPWFFQHYQVVSIGFPGQGDQPVFSLQSTDTSQITGVQLPAIQRD